MPPVLVQYDFHTYGAAGPGFSENLIERRTETQYPATQWDKWCGEWELGTKDHPA